MTGRATVEFWTSGIGLPTVAQRQAVAAEAAGWDGIVFPDSPNLTADPFIASALAARETSRLKFGTGVTNPIGRHVVTMATAAASVQASSGGRFVLGIGRGDSALAHIGKAPVPVERFERYVSALRRLLAGHAVAFDDIDGSDLPSLATLGLASAPDASQVRWIRAADPTVPLDITATGPKVIAVAARHADTVTFTVGADPDRIGWALDVARGTPPAGDNVPTFGAYINTACHPDPDTARTLVAGAVATFARFSVMNGRVSVPGSAETDDLLRTLHSRYDMEHHADADSAQVTSLTREFIDSYAIAGPVELCIARLRGLLELGLTRLICFAPSPQTLRQYPDEVALSNRLLADEVLPALRAN